MKSRLPKKGRAVDAEKGEHNMIEIAFQNRSNANFVMEDLNEIVVKISKVGSTTDTENEFQYSRIVVSQSNDLEHEFTPSQLLSDKSWIIKICKCFDGNQTIIGSADEVTDDSILLQSNILLNLLQSRLEKHLDRRLSETPSKKNHWIVK